MEKIIFFGLVIPILAFVLYLGGTAIMNGFSAKSSNKSIDKEEEDIDALEEEGTFALRGTRFGFDAITQISTFMEGQQVVVQRRLENMARLELLAETGYSIKLEDNGERFDIMINKGGDVYISIVQE